MDVVKDLSAWKVAQHVTLHIKKAAQVGLSLTLLAEKDVPATQTR